MKNRRDAFRVDFKGKYCKVDNGFRIINGFLQNVSAIGAEVEVYRERLRGEVFLSFDLLEVEILRRCEIVREDFFNDGRIRYGMRLLNKDEEEREELHQLLFRIEALRGKQREF